MQSRILWMVCGSLSLFLLSTGEAFAYGPVIHAQLSLHVLAGLSFLTIPALRQLLEKHGDAFTYGSMAADVIIGKSLAKVDKHPHNWDIGFSVLEETSNEAQRAFAWGYLSHLAADVVAHNYFVPAKLVESFKARTTGHAYWELRLDQLATETSWEAVHRISKQDFAEQEELLSRTIDGTIFRFETNLTIFNGWLFLQRLKRWQTLLHFVARRSSWIMAHDEASDFLELSIEAIRSLLNEQKDSWVVQADPTGWRNLKVAKKIRLGLRKQRRQQSPEQIQQWIEDIGQSFRQSLFEPEQLVLPALPFSLEMPPPRRQQPNLERLENLRNRRRP